MGNARRCSSTTQTQFVAVRMHPDATDRTRILGTGRRAVLRGLDLRSMPHIKGSSYRSMGVLRRSAPRQTDAELNQCLRGGAQPAGCVGRRKWFPTPSDPACEHDVPFFAVLVSYIHIALSALLVDEASPPCCAWRVLHFVL